MKISELPRKFRDMYERKFCWTGDVSLIALGAVKDNGNPYFAVTERNVENCIVRWFGNWPISEYSPVHVQREDGSTWAIRLDYFDAWERIDHVDLEAVYVDINEILKEVEQ